MRVDPAARGLAPAQPDLKGIVGRKTETSGPISVQDLLAERKRALAESARPRFLSKQERQALAHASSSDASSSDGGAGGHQKDNAPATTAPPHPQTLRSTIAIAPAATKRSREDYSYYESCADRLDRTRRLAEQQHSDARDRAATAELQAIKARYLGADAALPQGAKPSSDHAPRPNKRARARNTDKFAFEWDAQEDTSGESGFGGAQTIARFYAPTAAELARLARLANPPAAPAGAPKKDVLDMASSKYEHWSEKALDKMTDRDWRIFREDYQIAVKNGPAPCPIRYWHEAQLPAALHRIIVEAGYTQPTPIQRQAVPVVTSGRDLIGIAETGSGKTAAFLIPVVCRILAMGLPRSNAQEGPTALVLAPTRELAQQIDSECLKLARPLGIMSVSVVGGLSRDDQGHALRAGCSVVIATPGRMKDMIESKYVTLDHCAFMVLDEADRMLDMGFEADLLFILESLPRSVATGRSAGKGTGRGAGRGAGSAADATAAARQTVMFTATMTPTIERLAVSYLKTPLIVTIGNAGQAANTVVQRVIMTTDKQKPRLLADLVTARDFSGPAIVFVSTKVGCEQLARHLDQLSVRVCTLHGGKSQDQRNRALDQLRDGSRPVMIATDVAARGLDVPDVKYVVNYDMSKTIEEYTHRIGRTGRAGRSGTAITYLTEENSAVFYALRKMLAASPLSSVPPELASHPESFKPRLQHITK